MDLENNLEKFAMILKGFELELENNKIKALDGKYTQCKNMRAYFQDVRKLSTELRKNLIDRFHEKKGK